MNKVALVLLVALCAVSCEIPEPGPAPVSFLKIDIIEPYRAGLDQWIFATNENGELMDVQRLKDGVELATTLDFTSFDLSILRVDFYQTKIFNLTTYRNFDQREITLTNQYPQSQQREPAGQAKVTVTGIPENGIYSNIYVTSSLWSSSMEGNWTYTKNSYSVYKLLAKQSDRILVSTVRSGTPVYHFFNNVTDGSSLTIDHAAMTPQQELFTVDLKGGYGTVRCNGLADDDQSNYPFNYTDGSPDKPLKVTLVPGFSKYITQIGTSTNLGYVNYTRKGPALASYSPPDYFIDVTDPTVSNLTASFNLPYDYQFAVWRRSEKLGEYNTINVVSVSVYSDKSSTPTVNFGIPAPILREHPSLTLDKLTFENTSFTRSLGTYSYSDFLAERFRGTVKSEYERYEFFGN